MDLNRIHLTGRLGREPLLYDVGDHPVAALSLISVHTWRSVDGMLRFCTTSYRLLAWEAVAEQCGRELHRGDRVYIEGRLHRWRDPDRMDGRCCHTIVLDYIERLAAGPAPCGGAIATSSIRHRSAIGGPAKRLG